MFLPSYGSHNLGRTLRKPLGCVLSAVRPVPAHQDQSYDFCLGLDLKLESLHLKQPGPQTPNPTRTKFQIPALHL